jgi:hypothetical protein
MFFTFLLLDDEAKWKRSFSKRNQIGVRRMSPVGSCVASTAYRRSARKARHPSVNSSTSDILPNAQLDVGSVVERSYAAQTSRADRRSSLQVEINRLLPDVVHRETEFPRLASPLRVEAIGIDLTGDAQPFRIQEARHSFDWPPSSHPSELSA